VHAADVSVLPARLARPSSWDSYLDARIRSWRDYEAGHVECEEFMRLAAAWLDANRPPPAPMGLVHGDYQISNVLVSPGGSLSLVDWELTSIGDPREDLGWWRLGEASTPLPLVGENEEEFCRVYRERTGLDETVVNPRTIAYFTVLASSEIFIQFARQTAAMARDETTSMRIAYLTVSMNFMHGVWIDAMRRHGSWT
jgi:aminoglycoside phosphotransferase (APT) family kinase protein